MAMHAHQTIADRSPPGPLSFIHAGARKRMRRTISPPVPPPSPFLPYASSDFSVPMEKVLSSQLSMTMTTVSSDHGHSTALKHALPLTKAADDWRSMLALKPEQAAGGSHKASSGRFQRLFACLGGGAVYM